MRLPRSALVLLLAWSLSSAAAEPVPAQQGTRAEYLGLFCQQIERDAAQDSAQRSVDPILVTRIFFSRGKKLIDMRKLSVTVESAPKHGTLREDMEDGRRTFWYESKGDYLGRDEATFNVRSSSADYRIIITIKMVEALDEREGQTTCPEDTHRRIR